MWISNRSFLRDIDKRENAGMTRMGKCAISYTRKRARSKAKTNGKEKKKGRRASIGVRSRWGKNFRQINRDPGE